MLSSRRLLPGCLALVLLVPFAAAGKDVAVGDRIANVHFKDIHYLPRSLDDFGKKNAVVLVFTREVKKINHKDTKNTKKTSQRMAE